MCAKQMPYFLSGEVVAGFGRGSKALGVPTANLEENVVQNLPNDMTTGIYYGWASVNKQIYEMVASIGWNPFYKNEKKTVVRVIIANATRNMMCIIYKVKTWQEVHLLHKFENDFYGEQIKVIFVGYIRPEKDFSSVDELIKAINDDIAFAREQLQKPENNAYKDDQFLVK